MVWHKQRRGSFLLEAAVVLLMVIGAAGSIAHFATVTTRARQQQWVQFQQETQVDNIVERLRHAAPAKWEATANQLMADERYGRPRIDINAIEVNGVSGQHVVITAGAANSESTAKQTEFWRFDAAETGSANANAVEEEDDDDIAN